MSSESTLGGATSYWIKFFKDAGIPAAEAVNYAVIFMDNRIQTSMLLDLTKEYLSDMGISIMGDVISVLKHAKSVHSQEISKERRLRAAPFTSNAPTKRSTPASRTVDHYLKTKSDPDAVPMNSPNPAPLTAPTPAASVFNRLGGDPDSGRSSPIVTPKNDKSSSVFNRLGAVKRAATSTSLDSGDSDDDAGSACEYMGILKPGAAKKPKVTVTLPPSNISKRLGAAEPDSSSSAGIFSSPLDTPTSTTSTARSSALSRLGPKIPETKSTTKKPVALSRRGPEISTKAAARLGPEVNALSRLGPQVKATSRLGPEVKVTARLGPQVATESATSQGVTSSLQRIRLQLQPKDSVASSKKASPAKTKNAVTLSSQKSPLAGSSKQMMMDKSCSSENVFSRLGSK